MLTRKMIVGMFVAVLIYVTGTAWGATYYVDPNGVDDPNGGDPNNPFRTIKYAIGRCSDVNDDIIYIQNDPNEPNDYIEEPMLLKSNLQLDFSQGVVVEAKSGFGYLDCLFEAIDKEDIIFRGQGTGATLQMLKSEYTTGEQRHVIALKGCSDVNIVGLTLKDSGGDGVEIRRSTALNYSQNILIRDVVCDNNRRCGMGIISVDGLTIEDCVLKNTKGTDPCCGIDFEPDGDFDKMANIEMRNTIIENNAKDGLIITLSKVTSDFGEVSMVFEDLYITGGARSPIRLYRSRDNGPDTGLIEFRDVLVEDANYETFIWKSKNSIPVTFTNCEWRDISESANIVIGIYGDTDPKYNLLYNGGVTFNDCQVFDDLNRPAIGRASSSSWGSDFYEIHGDIYVQNPNCAPKDLSDWGPAELYRVDIVLHSDDVNVGDCKAHNETNHHCYPSIQSAINDANEFDVINVCQDTHYETIDFNGLSITVTSRDPEIDDVVVNTIIDANSAGRVVTFDSGEDVNSILTGFTITGGYAPGTGIDRDGGGIFCYGSSPTISRCVIYDNYAGDDGGGIFCDSGSDPEIYACSINYNDSGDKGGAMYCRNSDPHVKGCDLSSNKANEGGGIYCSSSEPQIENCIISENQTIGTDTSPDGGGICCLSSSPNILNGIISDNFADDDGGGIWCDDGSDPNIVNCTLTQNEADDKGGGIYCRNSDPVITNCILWDDTASTGDEIYTSSSTPIVSYSDVEGGCSGAYNINSDPCFVDADANDFHLGVDSPCINAGDPNGDYTGQTDIDGDPRVMCGRVDMGADEFSPVANWTMDDNDANTTVLDSSEHRNNGTFNDESGDPNTNAHNTTGEINGALSFDGVDDFVLVSDSDSISVGNHDYTICAWICPDLVTGLQGIVAKVKNTSDKEYAFGLNGSRLSLDVEKDSNNGCAHTSSGVVTASSWQHVAICFNSSSKSPSFYCDGQEKTTTYDTIDELPDELNDDLYIGMWGGAYNDNEFQGKIDEVMIFDYALGAEEISVLANR